MAFIFDAQKGQTPQSVARQREIAARLMGQIGNRSANSTLDGIGNAIASIGQGFGARTLNKRADEAEQAGQAGASSIYDQLVGALSGSGPAQIQSTSPSMPMDPASQRVASAFANQGDMSAYGDAIASIESAGSGGYEAVGPTHPELGRALGKYQVMEANIGPWSQEALGRPVSAEEFLQNPEIQEQVFNHRFGQYVNQYGPEGAAQAWFGGPGGVGQTDRQDSLGTSIGAYTDKFNAALGGGGQAQAQTPGQMAGGPDLQMLMQAASNPWLNEGQRSVINALLQQQMQAQDPSHQLDMDYRRAQIDALNAKAAGGGKAELGLNPQYGVDADGNPVLIQIGKDGNAVQTAMPEGVQLSKEPIRMDAGTHFVLLDPITRQPVGTVPKNNYDPAFDSTSGSEDAKRQAAAREELPKVEDNAYSIISMIESLDSDPYLDSMVGPAQSRLPNVTGAAARVQSKMDQIGGQAFLQAFATLRGGGQISNVEGQKATEAIARLNTAQNPKDYREALGELKRIVQTSLDRARKAANEGGSVGPPPTGSDGWQDIGGVKIRRKQ